MATVQVEIVSEPNYEISHWFLYPQNYGNLSGREDKLKILDHGVCASRPVYRNYFGMSHSELHLNAVPESWSSWFSVMAHTLPNPRFWTFNYPFWQSDTLTPFLLAIGIILFAIIALIPILLISIFVWCIIFNVRFLFHKRVKKIFRKLLIQNEKFRRWKLRHSYPTQHFRKLQERDRYRLPKAFHDSDHDDDDEPKELQRELIPRQRTTMWKEPQIKMIGFDPDNLPMDMVYGDLIGEYGQMHPVLKEYVKMLKKMPASPTASVGGSSHA